MNTCIIEPELHTLEPTLPTITHSLTDVLRDGVRSAASHLIFSTLPTQAIFQRLIGGPRDVRFTFTHGLMRGMSFRCHSTNRYYLSRESYERDMLSPLKQLVRPGMTVYEIGAHFGFWALALSRLVGPGGKVFAFEPSALNFGVLRQNITDNRCENVEAIPFALSDVEGPIGFAENGSMSHIETNGSGAFATTLDAFCKAHPAPDFILMDVEGYGANVLRGGTRTLSGRDCPMICEIHGPAEEKGIFSFLKGREMMPKYMNRGFPCRAIL